MRTKTSLRGLTLLSLTTLLFVVLYAAGISNAETSAGSSQVAATIERSLRGRQEFTFRSEALPVAPPLSLLLPLCPGPSVRLGNQCVLKEDVKLTQALVLTSNIALDCQGHKLQPKLGSPSTLDPPPPQVGIFLNNVETVVIKGCVIEGFDFGIFAINSKEVSLKGNTIKARYTGVSLMSVNFGEVSASNISFTTAGGRALYVGRNSHIIRILGNTFEASFVSTNPTALRVPGPESAANPRVVTAGKNPGSVVVITEIEGGEPTLLNAVIEGKLFQLSRTPQVTTSLTGPNPTFTGDIGLEGNTIRFSPALAVDGITSAVAQNTVIRNNKVIGGANAARAGIRVGMQNGLDRVFPGKCTLKPERSCLDDAGCNISGIDTQGGVVTTSIGVSGDTCTPRDVRTVSWLTRDNVIDGNEVTGPFAQGINTAGHGTTLTGNTIKGGTPPTGIGIGLLGKHAIETTTVTRNSVSNVEVALNLVKSFQELEALSFGAKISLNDFTTYDIAVLTSKVLPPTPDPFNPAAFYNLSSQLSVAGKGNFWGILSCPAFDPAKVVKGESTSGVLVPDIHHVVDSHPFKVSIARTATGQLPAPCF
jgi:hypothetical protein